MICYIITHYLKEFCHYCDIIIFYEKTINPKEHFASYDEQLLNHFIRCIHRFINS